MIEHYITRLNHTSIKADKIEALEIPIEGLESYLYYDHSKKLHLIIKSNETISENRKGIKVKTRILDIVNHGKHSFIDIVCTHDDFINEFVQIIDQIIDHFKEHRDLINAVRFIINKWYYFFEKETNVDLSESEVKGLIGELILIQNLSTNRSLKEIIKAWKGPESGLRDFNFPTLDIEVKTSSKEIGHVHTINGSIQLKSGEIPLFVYSVSLKKSDSTNSFTLKKLIDSTCLKIGDDAFVMNDFFERLEKLGVLVTKTERYDKFSFELKNILTVKIDGNNIDQFLIRSNNSRISNLKYDYDFNGLINTELT